MGEGDDLRAIVKEAVREELAPLVALLEEFEPVLRAYLDPAASGPGAWAVRQAMRRQKR